MKKLAVLIFAAAAVARLVAQQPPAQTPKSVAPIDLTGNWVSIVNEDWRWRMITPEKGDYTSVPVNPAGRAEADKWTPAQDGSCQAYGVAGLMRMPTRVRISWQDDNTLKIETDAAQQTRLLHFGSATGPGPAAPSGERSLQGYTSANWDFAGPPPRGGGPGGGGGGGGVADAADLLPHPRSLVLFMR